MSRVLGIDYGLSKIGLALGVGSLVEPYKILPNTPNHKLEADALSEIIRIAEREQVEVIVLGLPYRNGDEVGHAKIIRKFAEKLRGGLPENIKVEFVDESSTSKESVDVAISAGISQKRRKSDHAIAAGLIIKRFWEVSL